MGRLMSFSFFFSADAGPSRLLLELLHRGFSGFLKPQAGIVRVEDQTLEFGSQPLGVIYRANSLLEGEEIVVPGITTLTGYPDATQKIIDFLNPLPMDSESVVELTGNCQLGYVECGRMVKRWLFRCGDDWKSLIVHFRASTRSGNTIVGVSVYCPWFFLKNWWPKDVSGSSNDETAEGNWLKIVDLAQLIAQVGGENKLNNIALTLEGSGPICEEEWLVARARHLPKLEVYHA